MLTGIEDTQTQSSNLSREGPNKRPDSPDPVAHIKQLISEGYMNRVQNQQEEK
jgi:hypothetical protein